MGSRVAHFRQNGHSIQQIEVGIWGPPLGREIKERSTFPQRIRHDLPYFKHDIQAKWSADERCRFERYKSTRFPSVDIGKKPWSEEELQWLRNEGIEFDEMVERAKIRHDEEHPEDAGIKTRKEHFDRHTRYHEPNECEQAFSPAQRGFVNQVWGDAKGFMYMYGYRYEVDDDCRMAAMQMKDIMREQGLEVSDDEEWESEDEDESVWEDTEEEICECEHNKCECVDGIDQVTGDL
ncbi:hypothetical protein F25303_4765 [Fusarium sp. NRRL 25303]|nr:hypothetical protein F25303_4765 [Fusarium sp. NRRL 25303]